ncbi:Alpha-tocopherol transfer protein-like [Frankliniella fusca]|uniref:Alpha-tocopherol transfer protein-like n=1 Tax=Frankliniella fusca TaxID=407009 RepID=A0AAE1HHC0_9NEOP|nr:Alpha-tocopherol transfer protein-like [Frankliniella fusca]
MTLEPPTPEQLKRMKQELDQDPEITKDDVKRLREWLRKQPHLPSHMEDERLERFLYGCKFSLERTKHVLDTYYRVRATSPEIFGNRDPLSDELQRNIRDMSYFVLPKLTSEGYRVTIFRLNNTDVDKFVLQELTKRVVMCLDVRLKEEKCLSNIMVVDFQGFSLQHFAKFSPTLAGVRKAMLCVQDAFPLRLHQVHFTNCMPIVDKVAAAFTPLLKEKLVKKFFFHSNLDKLYRHVDPEILPNEYGGKAGTFEELNDAWRRKLESYQKWFLEEEKISKSDESRRLKKMPQSAVLQDASVEGSFRKLVID